MKLKIIVLLIFLIYEQTINIYFFFVKTCWTAINNRVTAVLNFRCYCGSSFNGSLLIIYNIIMHTLCLLFVNLYKLFFFNLNFIHRVIWSIETIGLVDMFITFKPWLIRTVFHYFKNISCLFMYINNFYTSCILIFKLYQTICYKL